MWYLLIFFSYFIMKTCCWYVLEAPSLRKHAYSNILKILPPKKWKFSDKNSDIFHISAQNIDCGYSLEPTHQCTISGNIKIKRIQRWNNDAESTARYNWNAEAKENQQLDSGGPDQSQSIRYQLKSHKAGAVIESENLTCRRATKEVPEYIQVINRDWVNYHACSLSHFIYVVPTLYISKNDSNDS